MWIKYQEWHFLLSRFFEMSNLPVFDITFINGKLWLALYFIVAYETPSILDHSASVCSSLLNTIWRFVLLLLHYSTCVIHLQLSGV